MEERVSNVPASERPGASDIHSEGSPSKINSLLTVFKAEENSSEKKTRCFHKKEKAYLRAGDGDQVRASRSPHDFRALRGAGAEGMIHSHDELSFIAYPFSQYGIHRLRVFFIGGVKSIPPHFSFS